MQSAKIAISLPREVYNTVEKLRQMAEATLKLSKIEIHAHCESDDMYKTIDLLICQCADIL